MLSGLFSLVKTYQSIPRRGYVADDCPRCDTITPHLITIRRRHMTDSDEIPPCVKGFLGRCVMCNLRSIPDVTQYERLAGRCIDDVYELARLTNPQAFWVLDGPAPYSLETDDEPPALDPVFQATRRIVIETERDLTKVRLNTRPDWLVLSIVFLPIFVVISMSVGIFLIGTNLRTAFSLMGASILMLAAIMFLISTDHSRWSRPRVERHIALRALDEGAATLHMYLAFEWSKRMGMTLDARVSLSAVRDWMLEESRRRLISAP